MAITVTTSPTKIYAASAVEHLVDVRNNGPAVITLGKTSAVTATSGMTLASGATEDVDLAPGEELYAIVPSGTATVDVL